MQATALFCAPPIVLFLTASPFVKKHHFEHMHMMMSGAAPLAKTDIDKFYERFDIDLNVFKFHQGGCSQNRAVASTRNSRPASERDVYWVSRIEFPGSRFDVPELWRLGYIFFPLGVEIRGGKGGGTSFASVGFTSPNERCTHSIFNEIRWIGSADSEIKSSSYRESY